MVKKTKLFMYFSGFFHKFYFKKKISKGNIPGVNFAEEHGGG